ncbi:unnamed protein product [Closterium sp. NIES-64]|nr:unnamed protein product [Closterium sp. NIES-64]
MDEAKALDDAADDEEGALGPRGGEEWSDADDEEWWALGRYEGEEVEMWNAARSSLPMPPSLFLLPDPHPPLLSIVPRSPIPNLHSTHPRSSLSLPLSPPHTWLSSSYPFPPPTLALTPHVKHLPHSLSHLSPLPGHSHRT